MRPAGRSETDSLYFTYPEFSAPSPALRDKRAAAPVAIVGTGPIGMTAALALAREGILHYAAHSVRLIVRYKPAIAAGARSNAMVSLCCNIRGVKRSGRMHGVVTGNRCIVISECETGSLKQSK